MSRRRAPKASVVALPAGGDRAAFLDACYRLVGRAWVRLDEKRGRLSAALTPRAGGAQALGALLHREYAAALARKSGERAARALEAALLSRALEAAERVDARRRAPEPSLPAERLEEIARLVAEAEAAPRPRGVETPWSELRRKSP